MMQNQKSNKADGGAGKKSAKSEELERLRARNAQLEEQVREQEAELDAQARRGSQMSEGVLMRSRGSLESTGGQPPRRNQGSGATNRRRGSVAVTVSVPFSPEVGGTAEERRRSSTQLSPARVDFLIDDEDYEQHPVMSERAAKPESPVRKAPDIQDRINSTVREQLASLLEHQKDMVAEGKSPDQLPFHQKRPSASVEVVKEKKPPRKNTMRNLKKRGGEKSSGRPEEDPLQVKGDTSGSLDDVADEIVDDATISEMGDGSTADPGKAALANALIMAGFGEDSDDDEDSDDSSLGMESKDKGKGPTKQPKRLADVGKQPTRMTSFMVNVSKLLTNYKKTTSAKDVSKRPSKAKGSKLRRSNKIRDAVHYLPRGGLAVKTSVGEIQFGMPPETVKDSMSLGLNVPQIYVVPRERFNLSAGVNVCEIEFPAFYNFFIRQRKTTLVTHRYAYNDLLTIMAEALNGPHPDYLFADREYSDFCPDHIRAGCPDHTAEIFHFRAPNRKPGQIKDIHMLDIDMLLEFKFYDDDGVCDLGDGVKIYDDEENNRFELLDSKLVAEIRNEGGLGSDDELAIEDDQGIIVTYRAAESCAVPVTGGLVPRLDITDEEGLFEDEELYSKPNSGSSQNVQTMQEVTTATVPRTRIGSKALQHQTSQLSASSTTTRKQRKSLLKFTGSSDRRQDAQRRPSRKSSIGSEGTITGAGRFESETFIIPKFGLTVLGNSHGFDEKGSTSGFVLWVNGQGVMVDPPPHSTTLLLDAGIQPSSITALILTHCHADHDAGTFQKMITEHKITLMTTATIFESFKRKYAAVSGLRPEFIQQLVNFRPVFLEEPNYWNGASLRFFYSLHSIPCVGFQATFEGKEVVYSGDTFYDPEAMRKMAKEGILSEERLQALLNFPWTCDVVLHEAGVPPIHTPLEALNKLPPIFKKNVRLIHIDGQAAERAAKFGFKIAKSGVESTIVLIPRGEEHKMLKFLHLLGSIEIFRHFEISQAIDLMLMSQEVFYPKGSMIMQKGTRDERFMIILQGRAIVEVDDLKKFYRAGDYLGELAAWKQSRIIKQKSMSPDRFAEAKVSPKDRPMSRRFQDLHFGDLKAMLEDPSMNGNGNLRETDDEEGELSEVDDQLVKETVRAETDVRLMEIDKYALNYLLINDPVLRERLEAMIHSRIDGSWEAISSNTRLRLLSSMQKTQLQGLLTSQHLSRGEVVWSKGDPVEIAVLISRGSLVFEEVHGRIGPGEETSTSHAPLSTGMLLFDYYGFHNNRPLTTTLVCASARASIFVLDSRSMLHFLDKNPMILLALLKSPILI